MPTRSEPSTSTGSQRHCGVCGLAVTGWRFWAACGPLRRRGSRWPEARRAVRGVALAPVGGEDRGREQQRDDGHRDERPPPVRAALERLLAPAVGQAPDHEDRPDRHHHERDRREVVGDQRRRLCAPTARAAARPVSVARNRDEHEQRGHRRAAQQELSSPTHDRTLDEHRDRVPLGLEDGLLDVAEVLAVGLQRKRPVAGDLDPVEIVRRRGRRSRPPAPCRGARSRGVAGRRRGPTLAGATRSSPSSNRASGATCSGHAACVGVRIGVRRRARTPLARGPAPRARARSGRACSAASLAAASR